MNVEPNSLSKGKFKDYPFQQRYAESARVLAKYQGRVPVIVEKTENSTVPSLNKMKYLVPFDLTVGQFMFVIHKQMKNSVNHSPEQAIFLFVNGKIPATSANFGHIYDTNKDKDGFLYITYSGENTFGTEDSPLQDQKQSVLQFLKNCSRSSIG